MFKYKTKGTCSKQINLDIQNDVINTCAFVDGCGGNTQGVSRLVQGMSVDEAISRLKGIQCRNGTSCPDQLALALEKWKKQQASA